MKGMSPTRCARVAPRAQAGLRNFAMFGAPHAAFVFLAEPFGVREAVDCGMFAQNLMLLLTAEGLASIVMDRLCDLYVLAVFVAFGVIRYSPVIAGRLAFVTWGSLAAIVFGPLLLLIPGVGLLVLLPLGVAGATQLVGEIERGASLLPPPRPLGAS